MTQSGIESVKDVPQRQEKARQIFKAVGGEIKEIYFTFGKYDLVTIAETPSDEAMAKAMLIVGRAGSLRTETLKAFPEAEGIAIIKRLS
jgi:uncharacterized protein with GYD domain